MTACEILLHFYFNYNRDAISEIHLHILLLVPSQYRHTIKLNFIEGHNGIAIHISPAILAKITVSKLNIIYS